MRLKRIETAVIIALIGAIAFHLISFGATSKDIYSDVLRLHILANSDSQQDQALKIKVRDAVLKQQYDVFDGASDITEAKQKISSNLNEIQSIAIETVKQNGYDYPVSVALEKTYFETRYYKDFTLPAGRYEALRIVIGDGKGHNWWCVMFPPLCLGAAADIENNENLSSSEKELITSDPRYEIRFKAVELYQKAKEWIAGE